MSVERLFGGCHNKGSLNLVPRFFLEPRLNAPRSYLIIAPWSEGQGALTRPVNCGLEGPEYRRVKLRLARRVTSQASLPRTPAPATNQKRTAAAATMVTLDEIADTGLLQKPS